MRCDFQPGRRRDISRRRDVSTICYGVGAGSFREIPADVKETVVHEKPGQARVDPMAL